jgi:Ecdysteroid kinase-like family
MPMMKEFTNDNLPYPRCLFAGHDHAGEIIAMEDLSVQGYTMANRVQGLDFEHCALVMKVNSTAVLYLSHENDSFLSTAGARQYACNIDGN